MTLQYRIAGVRADEISASVEDGVRRGELRPGALLPPVRRLAEDLGVSPTTVAAAYAQLRRRGLVETGGRRGTRIRSRPSTAPLPGPTPGQPAGVGRPTPAGGLTVPAGARDLAHGEPDPALLPPLGPVLARLAADWPDRTTGYLDDPLLPELRETATARLAADGVPAPALTCCHGALDAIERCLLSGGDLAPGDRIGIEDPGWANLLDLVAAAGLEPVGMAVDDEGVRPDGLATALRRGCRAVVLTSRAQNPTGASLTPARAAELRTVLAASDPSARPLLLEDDHAAELAGTPLATLAGASDRWAVIRSASKPYGPDLRFALLAGDRTTVARVVGRRRLGPGWVSMLTQRVVAALWRDDEVAASVARAAARYDERRRALLDELTARGVPASGRTGLNIWVPVLDETTAVTALRDAGIVVSPGARQRLTSPPAIRVTVSTLQPADAPGVADAIASAVTRRPRRPHT